MSKKFYDIFPPNTNIGKEEKKVERKEAAKKNPIKSSFYLKGISIFSAILFILAGVFFYFKLPRLELEIWPKTESIALNAEITVNKDFKDIDVFNKIIPGEILKEEKELWQEFEATGTVVEEEKAKGIIRVFNKHSPASPITLRATTRFLSDGGKYFVSPKSIYIPANSWVDVEVVAMESGEDYNIKPANFSVPGLVGTAFYYNVYGESSAPMQGGFKRESKQVTEEDIRRAENILTEKALADIEISLKNKIPPEFVLLDDAVLKEVLEASTLVEAGSVVSQFNFRVKVNIKTLVFNKSDLESFAKEFIISEIPDSKDFFQDSLKINYRSQFVNVREEKLSLDLEIFAKIYPSVGKEELLSLIKGKKAKEIEESILGNFSDKVSRVKINFWPFWVKKSPQNINRIQIKLNSE